MKPHCAVGSDTRAHHQRESGDDFQDDKARWPSGYVLRLGPNGAWELISLSYKQPIAIYASGTIALDRKVWHQIALSFAGTKVTASLDGRQLAAVEATAHSHGMIGLGSEWNHVQFDNLSVK